MGEYWQLRPGWQGSTSYYLRDGNGRTVGAFHFRTGMDGRISSPQTASAELFRGAPLERLSEGVRSAPGMPDRLRQDLPEVLARLTVVPETSGYRGAGHTIRAQRLSWPCRW